MKRRTTVKDIYIGKPDARDEINFEGYENFIKSFVMPPNFDFNGLLKGNKCFVRGYKGTGKTALLYFLDTKIKEEDQAACSSYIFFKGEYGSVQRQQLDNISKKIVSSMIIQNEDLINEQDFEYIWRWILYRRIIEDNEENNCGIFMEDDHWRKFKHIISLILPEKTANKLLSIPRKIKIGLGYSVDALGKSTITPEVLLDFDEKNNIKEYSLFIKLIDDATEELLLLKRSDIPYYIFVDELEAFYAEKAILKRDLRMLRDLIITTKFINNIFVNSSFSNTKIICSIRTEILNSISRFIPAKEINKVTSGFECPLIWDYNNTNSYSHPIFEIWLKRIEMSEKKNGVNYKSKEEIYKNWFEEEIDGVPVVNYILNYSWSKPRDIVRFLDAAKNSLHSNSTSYTQAVFDASLKEYSRKSLEEVEEELNALYSPEEKEIILSCLRGFKPRFTYNELKDRISRYFENTILQVELVNILKDLYRIGIIGNYSVSSKTYRWQHKGSDGIVLDDDWSIEVHRALQKELSLYSKYGKSQKYFDNVQHLFKEGDIVKVGVVKIVPGFLIVTFEADSIVYRGSIHISQLADYYIDDIFLFAAIGDTFIAKILNYDPNHAKWNLTLKGID
ncbi:hypothetical protein HBE96_18675 [Clostridium sp. P21]|uniref:S1 motif domain-containing protein n=1 Tax=Clostridium muellerianum TaxID=2716538 RepID=A0A7Y0HPW5_9CLOT|nr:hypothetical protein [Clostridium muellerianum]NMM64635.1 hypothetical protein [Clostridium muellerianum]